MPLYEKGDVRIHYAEVGSGFPLLVIPGGGLNSTVAGLATHPFQTPPTHPLPLCELKPTVLGAWSRRDSPASSRVTIAC